MAGKTASTEDIIYSAAVDLMSERGYHAASLREIAKNAGLQMSSLYYYFPSKQDLLLTIMQRTIEELISTVKEAMGEADTPDERLRAAMRAHILFHAKRRNEAFITDSELRALDRQSRARVVDLRDRYEKLIEDTLRDGGKQGIFGITAPNLATYAFVAIATDVATWYRPTGPLSLEAIADHHADLLLHGVMATSSLEVR